MRRSDNRQDGGPVGLLPAPRERRNLVSHLNRGGDGLLESRQVWTLLAVAYIGVDGRGADLRSLGTLISVIRPETATDADLERSLRRLVDAGLIHECDGLYYPAELVLEFLRGRTFRRGVAHDHRDLLWLVAADRPGRLLSTE